MSSVQEQDEEKKKRRGVDIGGDVGDGTGVLIPLGRSGGSLQEWAMIELQGSLDIRHPATASPSCEQLEIGSLALKENGVPTMTIGSHFLEGSVVELKKPLLVIQNTKDHRENIPPTKNYNVVGVVKKKYLFRSRPKPVATNK